MSWDDQRVREHVQHVEDLLGRLDDGPATAAVRALAELYGEALARVVRIAADAGLEPELTRDELLTHLLLLHGLHPEPVEDRVRQALHDLAPRLAKHEVRAEVVSADDTTVRLVLDAAGCGSTRKTMAAAVEDAVRRAAPEVERVEIEPRPAEPVLIPLNALGARK
jgi:Fe-S cluster biogenesis protein NfuA